MSMITEVTSIPVFSFMASCPSVTHAMILEQQCETWAPIDILELSVFFVASRILPFFYEIGIYEAKEGWINANY